MRTAKENAINLVKAADLNFLMALKGIKAGDIIKQPHPEVNAILWIVGHCVSHMDAYLSSFTGKRVLTNEQKEYFIHSSPKRSMEDGSPYSFIKIIDAYLDISKSYFKALEDMPEEKFNKKPSEKSEIFFIRQQRLALHLLGHTGQIVVIRRMLGNPTTEYWQDKDRGWSFVSGLDDTTRTRYKEHWLDWWIEFKTKK